VIEALLRLSYSIDLHIVEDICTMVPIIVVIVKQEAERRCKWWNRMTAVKLIPANPLAMYAILLALGRKSCDYNLQEEILIATRETLGRPIVRPRDEARLITTADFDRLLMYHSERKKTFLESQEEVWRKAGRQWPQFSLHCSPGRTVKAGGSYGPVMQWFLDFRSRVKKTFCKELRGEAIGDTSLWHDLLDRDWEAGKLCRSCVMSSALQMPAYAKILAKLSEEVISQVNRSSCSTQTRLMLWLDKTNHQILNGKLPRGSHWIISRLYLRSYPHSHYHTARVHITPYTIGVLSSLTHYKKTRNPVLEIRTLRSR